MARCCDSDKRMAKSGFLYQRCSCGPGQGPRVCYVFEMLPSFSPINAGVWYKAGLSKTPSFGLCLFPLKDFEVGF